MFNEPELDSSEFAWYKEIKPPVDSFLAAYENNPKGLYYEDIVNFFKHALPFIVGIYILSLNYFAGTLNFNIVRHLVIFIVTIVLALFCFIYGYIRYQKNKDNY